MKARRIRLMVLVGILLAIILMSLFSYTRPPVYREIFSALRGFRRAHAGRMPSDLSELARFAREQGYPMISIDRWGTFEYVSDLTTNDPPDTPVIVDAPKRPWQFVGSIAELDEDVTLVSRWRINRILREPWLPVQGHFESEAVLDDFKHRARVIRSEE